jgi:DnaJ-class molecular chaperone
MSDTRIRVSRLSNCWLCGGSGQRDVARGHLPREIITCESCSGTGEREYEDTISLALLKGLLANTDSQQD